MSERGVRSLPECEYAHYNLGRQLRACGRVNEAADAYAAAVRLNPTEVQYVNGYGTALQASLVMYLHLGKIEILKHLLQSVGRYDEATRAFNDAIKLSPGWHAMYRNLGLLEHERGDSAKALRWFEARVITA